MNILNPHVKWNKDARVSVLPIAVDGTTLIELTV